MDQEGGEGRGEGTGRVKGKEAVIRIYSTRKEFIFKK